MYNDKMKLGAVETDAEGIAKFPYKVVQAMAKGRTLPAYLRKEDMAMMIALQDAGSLEELEELKNDVLEERRERRARRSAAAHQNHVMAEADSASADMDEDFPAVEDDGDKDYEPESESKAKRPRKRASSSRRRAGPARPRRVLECARVSKKGRLIKNPHDANYVYASQSALMPNAMPYPMAPPTVPGLGPGAALVRSGYESEIDITSNLHPNCVNKTYVNTPIDAEVNMPPLLVKPISHPTVPSNNVSPRLEWLVNFKSSHLHMPFQLSPYWKPANTNIVNSYNSPISFTSSRPGLFQQSSHTLTKPLNPAVPNVQSAFQPFIKPEPGTCLESHSSLKFGTKQCSVFSQTKSHLEAAHAPSLFEMNDSTARPPALYQGPPPLQFPAVGLQCSTKTVYSATPHRDSVFEPVVKQRVGTNSKYDINQNLYSETKPFDLSPYEMSQSSIGPPSPYQGHCQPQYPTINQPPEQCSSVSGVQQPALGLYQDPRAWQDLLPHQQQPQEARSHSDYQKFQKLQSQQLIKKRQMQLKQLALSKKRQSQQHHTPCSNSQSVRLSSFTEDRSNFHHQQQAMPLRLEHAGQSQLPVQNTLSSTFQSQQIMNNPHHLSFQPQILYHQHSSFDPHHQPSQLHLSSVQQKQCSPAKKPCYHPNNILSSQETAVETKDFYEVPVPEMAYQKSSPQSQQVDAYSQLPFSEFRGQNQELSYPLILKYVRSAGEQVLSLPTKQSGIVENSMEGGLPDVLGPRLNELSHTNLVDTVQTSSPMTVHSTVDESQVVTEISAHEESSVKAPVTLDSIEEKVGPERVRPTDEIEPEIIVPDMIEHAEIAPNSTDTTVEKVVKENDDTKQVIFLCSDGAGDFEYMTLRVTQDELLKSTSESLPETAPVTPCTSDVANMDESYSYQAAEGNEQGSRALSVTSNHPSQVSTIPVTSSGESTATASSISDYLSNQWTSEQPGSDYVNESDRDPVTLTSDGESVQVHDGISRSQLTEDNVVPSAEECLQGIPNPRDKKYLVPSFLNEIQEISESNDTLRLVPSSGSLMDMSNLKSDGSREKTGLNYDASLDDEIVEIKERSALDEDTSETQEAVGTLMENPKPMAEIAVTESCNGPLMTTSELTRSSVDETLNLLQPLDVEIEKVETCMREESNSAHGVLNMNMQGPVSNDMQESVPHDKDEKSSLETNNNDSKGNVHKVPLLCSKSAVKVYQSKQARHPVRSSPRWASQDTSGRGGPCYSQSLSLPFHTESALEQPAKGCKHCPNVKSGCPLVLPPAQLSSHHLVCEFTSIECPAIGCGWECIAKKLCSHLREAHRGEIMTGSDSKHTVSIHEIRQQRLTFLREVSRKLFVICVHAFGNSIYATIQFVASGKAEKPVSATGTLEVVDYGGVPHHWRGKIGPIQQPLETFRNSGNCLEVRPELCIGSGIIPDSTVTFHSNIRVNLTQNQIPPAISSDPVS